MSDSDAQLEREELARAFATTLGHLYDIWDLRYVPYGRPSRVPEQRAGGVERAPASTKKGDAAYQSALRAQANRWSAATKLEYLQKKNLGDCKRCGLCRTRRNIVFGVGNAEADLMFIGEAPGADEDRLGEPFVGRAGQRLDQWIEALGLQRQDVYIANVLKCRPPGNRDPKPEEVDKCSPFLRAQIRAIAPRAIVALGRHAGMLLSGREDMSLRAMRQTRLGYDPRGPKGEPSEVRIPLFVTYHPAYVLRQEGSGQGDQATEAVMSDLRRALAVRGADSG